jgi:hypothetical protein
MYLDGVGVLGPSRPSRWRILVANTVCSQSSINSQRWPRPENKVFYYKLRLYVTVVQVSTKTKIPKTQKKANYNILLFVNIYQNVFFRYEIYQSKNHFYNVIELNNKTFDKIKQFVKDRISAM